MLLETFDLHAVVGEEPGCLDQDAGRSPPGRRADVERARDRLRERAADLAEAIAQKAFAEVAAHERV